MVVGVALSIDGTLRRWRAIGASVIGRSHAITMTRCQDVCAYETVETGDERFIAIAVADGAGTAEASHHGARIAVASAIDDVVSRARSGETLDDEALGAMMMRARGLVFEAAVEYERAPRDYASTLLVVVASSSETVAAQIGDGAIVIDDGTQLYPLTWPQQGEYANVTRFLIEDDAAENIVIARAAPARRIAVFSDGLQALALQYADRSAHAPFFEPFFQYLETSDKADVEIEAELIAYLDSADLNARTDDDKSLVLAVRQ